MGPPLWPSEPVHGLADRTWHLDLHLRHLAVQVRARDSDGRATQRAHHSFFHPGPPSVENTTPNNWPSLVLPSGALTFIQSETRSSSLMQRPAQNPTLVQPGSQYSQLR